MEDPNKLRLTSSQTGKQPPEKKVLWFTLVDAGIEFALMIALPLLIFVFIGKRYNLLHSVIYVIIGLLLSFSVTSLTIGRKINEIRKKLK